MPHTGQGESLGAGGPHVVRHELHWLPCTPIASLHKSSRVARSWPSSCRECTLSVSRSLTRYSYILPHRSRRVTWCWPSSLPACTQTDSRSCAKCWRCLAQSSRTLHPGALRARALARCVNISLPCSRQSISYKLCLKQLCPPSSV